jgi:hypothetical protein
MFMLAGSMGLEAWRAGAETRSLEQRELRELRSG